LFPSGKFPRIALLGAAALAALSILVPAEVSSPWQRHFLTNAVQAAVLLWATVCSYVVARRSSGFLRELWRLWTAALALLTATLSMVVYWGSFRATPVATPWPSDILNFVWVAPAVMMLLPRSREDSSAVKWLHALDFTQVGIVTLTAYLYFFYIPSLWEGQGAEMFRHLRDVCVARDALLAAGLCFRAVKSPRGVHRDFFVRMCAVFGAVAIFDFIDMSTFGESSQAADWAGAAWGVPYLLAVVVAASWDSTARGGPDSLAAPRGGWVASQLLPLCIPAVVIFMGHRIAEEQLTIAWVTIGTSFACFAARLILTNQRQLHIAEDLRRAEQALRRSEHIFSTAFRASPDAISIGLLPEGNIVELNESFTKLTGYAREEILGKTPQDLGLWEDVARMAEIRARFREQGAIRDEEFSFRKKGGVLRFGRMSANTISLDGRPCSLIIVRDVTEGKQAEEILRATQEERRVSQEMFTKAFRSSPDAITISTLAGGRYLEVNDGYSRLFGWRREEVLGKTTRELGIWPEPADREKLKSRLLDQGCVHQMEVTLRVKSGQLRTFLLSADVIELDAQACMLAVSDDITDWKLAQEALRDSEERFRTLVQHLDVGVVLHAPGGEIQFANTAAQRIFGLTDEEVLGKNSWELGLEAIREDGSDLPNDMRPVPRVIASGRPVQNLVMGWRRPGNPDILWIFGNSVPQFSADGKLSGVITSFANITEQKRTEVALRQLSTRLLQLQDEERRKLGRDLHDTLAQNVLAINLSLAQVTQGSPALDDRGRTLLGQARGMLQDMSRQIRTLSYLLHPPLLDELGLASAVKEYAEGFGSRSGIQLEVAISPGFGRLPQETETALFRIVQESLSNIQRHSSSRTARIRLDGSQNEVILEVSDQGLGMSQASGQRLNEPGARFGVGIVGMRERMAQLGGTLEIESGGAGTTVRATLPLKAEVLHAASHTRGG